MIIHKIFHVKSLTEIIFQTKKREIFRVTKRQIDDDKSWETTWVGGISLL